MKQFKVGDGVKILGGSARKYGEIEEVVGLDYRVNGVWWDADELQPIERDGERVDNNVHTSQQVCRGLSKREQFEQVAAKVFGPRLLQHNEYDPDKYHYEHVQARWVDWQFQIAALEATNQRKDDDG